MTLVTRCSAVILHLVHVSLAHRTQQWNMFEVVSTILRARVHCVLPGTPDTGHPPYTAVSVRYRGVNTRLMRCVYACKVVLRISNDKEALRLNLAGSWLEPNVRSLNFLKGCPCYVGNPLIAVGFLLILTALESANNVNEMARTYQRGAEWRVRQ